MNIFFRFFNMHRNNPNNSTNSNSNSNFRNDINNNYNANININSRRNHFFILTNRDNNRHNNRDNNRHNNRDNNQQESLIEEHIEDVEDVEQQNDDILLDNSSNTIYQILDTINDIIYDSSNNNDVEHFENILNLFFERSRRNRLNNLLLSNSIWSRSSITNNYLNDPSLVLNYNFNRNYNQIFFDNFLNYTFLNNTKKYKTVAHDSVIDNLQIRNYCLNDIENSSKCPILLEDFEIDDPIIQLPCKHIFNPDSIVNWLKNESNTCPVCRYSFISKEVFINDENQVSNDENQVSNDENLENDTVNNLVNYINSNYNNFSFVNPVFNYYSVNDNSFNFDENVNQQEEENEEFNFQLALISSFDVEN